MFSIVLWGGFTFCRSGARGPERQKVTLSFANLCKTIATDGPGRLATLRGSARSLDERHGRRNSGRDSPRRRSYQERTVSVFWKRVAASWGMPTQFFFGSCSLMRNTDTSSCALKRFLALGRSGTDKIQNSTQQEQTERSKGLGPVGSLGSL